MWILRWVLIALIVFILLGFSLQNTQETMINILGWSTGPIPIYLIVFLSFALSLVFFLLLAIFHQIRHHTQLSKCQKEIRQLKEELKNQYSMSSKTKNVQLEEKPSVGKTPTEETTTENAPDQNQNKTNQTGNI